MKTIRRSEAGMPGNGGQFAPTKRRDAVVYVPPARTAPGRAIDLDPQLRPLVESVEATYDAEGRTVVSVQVDREQLPTSRRQTGTAPWDIDDEDVTDEQVDAYLESRSDDPEAFADDLGFPGEARWNSASSTLELTHSGYEGVTDEDMSGVVGETLIDLRDDLRLHEWD